jgi:hypothetical protein
MADRRNARAARLNRLRCPACGIDLCWAGNLTDDDVLGRHLTADGCRAVAEAFERER